MYRQSRRRLPRINILGKGNEMKQGISVRWGGT
jgi:hypothetical protein